MPSEPNTGNGLNAFSMHAWDDSSTGALRQLRSERAAHLGMAPEGLSDLTNVDPETAARMYLSQALESPAAPTFTAPESQGAASVFKTIDTETVPLTGTRIVKFRQTLNGIPVYGSLVSVEVDEANDLVAIDSALGEPSGVEPIAAISPSAALETVRGAPDGYAPALDGVVPQLQYYFDREADTWRLVYFLEDVPVALSDEERAADAEYELEPPHFVDFVVDAHHGNVVAVLPRTPSAVAADTQTAVDAFGQQRTMLASTDGERLVLRDPVHNVETYDFRFGDPDMNSHLLPGELIVNPPTWSPAAVSSHANAAAISEFMRTVLRRNNIDNLGGAMVSTVNCVVAADSRGNNEWRNAYWSPRARQMVYGQVLRGNELRSLAANVDVVAHEIFHGVTDLTSRLEYAFQPGALNESYSDIFGTIIANFDNDDPRSWDWQLGDRLLPGDEPFRDLSDPPRFNQPDHMDDFRVLPNTRLGDYGGVHINSGIHNKAAFNLLTARGEDDLPTLTTTEVAAVFYLALTQRLSRTSQFADSRRAVISSARSLFRALPLDQQTKKLSAIEAAFDEVGIV
ncbi:M4 family metallopeptidase [Agromyces binzhouensis]|uniref:M4 family metallopeptidase n=1 Tax=Agromyces binzhouensis TaxID=1817495 RepID=UPI00362E45D8